jgi:hypothetical protein
MPNKFHLLSYKSFIFFNRIFSAPNFSLKSTIWAASILNNKAHKNGAKALPIGGTEKVYAQQALLGLLLKQIRSAGTERLLY